MIASIIFSNSSQFQGRRQLFPFNHEPQLTYNNHVIIRPDRESPKKQAEGIFIEPVSLRVFVVLRIKGWNVFLRTNVVNESLGPEHLVLNLNDLHSCLLSPGNQNLSCIPDAQGLCLGSLSVMDVPSALERQSLIFSSGPC